MADPKQVYGHYSFKLANLKNAEQGLLFFRATLPSSTTEVTTVKAWDENGRPTPVNGGGHQVSWQPITLTRYIDDKTDLWDWYKDVMEKGAVDGDTKQEPTITALNNDTPLFTWSLTGAVPTAYSHSDADAQTHGLMTETVTITYETAELKAG